MLWLLFWPLNILIRSFGVVARPQPPLIFTCIPFLLFLVSQSPYFPEWRSGSHQKGQLLFHPLVLFFP